LIVGALTTAVGGTWRIHHNRRRQL
jgi:hypothetical protein